MSGFLTWEAFAAFVLGVLLSTTVKAFVSKVRGGSAG